MAGQRVSRTTHTTWGNVPGVASTFGVSAFALRTNQYKAKSTFGGHERCVE